MNEHEKRAQEIFRQHGMTMVEAVRAGGWTNAVWLNGGFALRLSLTEGSDRIRREVALSQSLPIQVGYPPNIAAGVIDGHEWSLSKRIQGRPLSDVWAGLSWEDRRNLVFQILKIMEHVHSAPVAAVEPLSKRRAWYDAFSRIESMASIDQYARDSLFTNRQAALLQDRLTRFYDRLSTSPPVLNHGDITMDNLLWHEGEIVSLLDFEHSTIAPPELDLHSIINLALCPDDSFFHDASAGADGYRQDIAGLLRPMLSHISSIELLAGFAILFRLRFLFFDMQEGRDLHKSGAYRMLRDMLAGDEDYLTFALNTKERA